ncbi:hypothetical protein Tco_1361591 [Tanacetum coccineum]
MPTKIELTLEQSQQGVSNDVLILTLLSWETCQRDFSESLPDHWYSYYTIIGEIGGLDDGAVAASFQRSRIHKPHAHTQAFKVNQCNKYEHVVKKHKLINGGQIKMFKSKEVDADNDLKNSKSKDKGSRSSSTKANENQEDTRGRGGKIQKQKRNTTEEEGSSSQVNGQNGAYWKKFNIWYQKLRYWRHNSVPHCIDFMHVEKNVAESLVGTLLHVLGKTKDGVNARLDLAELGVKPELFAMQDEDKQQLLAGGHKTSFENRRNRFLGDMSTDKSFANGYAKRQPPKELQRSYYDEVDEEFSTVIHHRNDNVLSLVDRHDLVNESRDDYYRKDCGGVVIRKSNYYQEIVSAVKHVTVMVVSVNNVQLVSVNKYEYKDNGRFWGSKSGCNESDIKPSWKDIKKAKACMLVKAQASEASSKAKVEACGCKAKLQASTKTLIVKIPIRITDCVLGLGRGSLEVDSDVNLLYDVMFFEIIDISSDSSDDRRWAAKKASALVFYGPSTQRLLDAYGYNTIEEYLSWNYFPSTDNESTNMETTDKRNTDKDCIVDSNSAMSKGKYVPVCKKNKPNVYSHVQVTGSVLGLPNVTTWDEI